MAIPCTSSRKSAHSAAASPNCDAAANVVAFNTVSALQMRGVQDQQPIKTFRARGPHEPLGDAVRLRCVDRRTDDPDVLRLKDGIETGRERAIVIATRNRNELPPVARSRQIHIR
jgi:hypothetical protein